MADRHQQIARLRQRYQAAPDSKVFAPLADLLGREGHTEEALSLLEDGLSRHPEYLSGMVVLGRTLMEANRRDHARKVLVRVLDLDAANHVALGLLAQDAVDQEVWHVAEPWLTKLVKLEGATSRWGQLLEKARAQLRGEGASETSQPLTDLLATMTMVDIYIEQGYLKKALAALRLIETGSPGRPGLKDKIDQVLHLLDQQEAPPPGGSVDAAIQDEKRRLADQRALKKDQFHQWINGLDTERDQSP